MATSHKKRKMVAEINVVPYIDVMLVLLIIFMVTTPLLTEGIKVDLPKADAQVMDTGNIDPLIITVDKAGQFYLAYQTSKGFPLSKAELLQQASELLSQHPTLDVMIKGDQNINYGRVVEAMVTLKKAGAASVGLITDLSET